MPDAPKANRKSDTLRLANAVIRLGHSKIDAAVIRFAREVKARTIEGTLNNRKDAT